ncbi:MAG: DUF4870 domain-containing protein [Thermoplasmatota archaeon]
MNKTSVGMEENVEGALCYLLGWLTGLVFYLIEKDNEFVRFHARQSILVFLPLWILSFIFGGGFWFGGGFLWAGWFILVVIGWLLWLVMFILWLVLMIKAYQGEKFKLPVVGDIAERGF